MTTVLTIVAIVIIFIWRYNVNLNYTYLEKIEREGGLLKKHEKLVKAVQKHFNDGDISSFIEVKLLSNSKLSFEVIELEDKYFVVLIDKPNRYFFEIYDDNKKLIRKYNSRKDTWIDTIAGEMISAIHGGRFFTTAMRGQSFE